MAERVAPAFDAQSTLELQAGVPEKAAERPTQDPPRIGKDGKMQTPKELPLPDHGLMRYDSENPGKAITRAQLAAIKNHATNGSCRLCGAFLRGLQSGTAGTREIIAQEQKRSAQVRAVKATQRRSEQQPTVTRAQTLDQQIARLQELSARSTNPGLQVQAANAIYLLDQQKRAARSDAP
jgi:hypothetical protein